MEESANLVNNWLEAKIIIPAVTALICSGLLPFLHHKYKVKRERDEKLFETRKTEYQNYFKILDNAAKLAGQDYVVFMNKTLPDATRRLYEEESSTEAILNYQKVLNDFTIGMQEGFQKATSELTGLRIVCSRNLIEKLEQFESLYQVLLTMQPEMLRQLNEQLTPEAFLTGNYNFETEIQKKMLRKGNDLKNLRNQIIDTMRSELGYES
ncbi:hypothetical protein N9H48_06295 [Pseudoalteromonas marina]|nr:hypothetical protein [Pseudoalteromonas marina]